VAKDSLTETTLPLMSKVVLVCPGWNLELLPETVCSRSLPP